MASFFTSIDVFKERLGFAANDSTYDNALMDLLAGVESSVKGAIGSPVLLTQRSYWLAGTGGRTVVLPERPVYVGDVTDLHVYVVNQAYLTPTSADELTYQTNFDFGGNPDPMAGTDYRMEGTLQRVDGVVWPVLWKRNVNRLASALDPDYRVVRVVGVNVGWRRQDIPPAIVEAVYLEGAARWANRKSGANTFFQSESLNGYSYSNGQLQNNVNKVAQVPGLISPAAVTALAPFLTVSIACVR